MNRVLKSVDYYYFSLYLYKARRELVHVAAVSIFPVILLKLLVLCKCKLQ